MIVCRKSAHDMLSGECLQAHVDPGHLLCNSARLGASGKLMSAAGQQRLVLFLLSFVWTVFTTQWSNWRHAQQESRRYEKTLRCVTQLLFHSSTHNMHAVSYVFAGI